MVPRYLEPQNGRPIFVVRYMSWLLTFPVLILESESISGYRRTSFARVAVLTDAYIACGFAALLVATRAGKSRRAAAG